MSGTGDVSHPFGDAQPTPEAPTPHDLDVEAVPLPTHDELEAVRGERDAYLDQLQRERAEFANFRRRTERDRIGLRAGVIRDVIAQILPVLDNLERAVTALSAHSVDLGGGVDMVRGQLAHVLVGYGVEEIRALGEPFDPNVHDAIASVPTPSAPEGTVIEVVEKGYRTDGELVRPAKVVVATGVATTGGA
jgi:molecular chaperone GrpE